MQLRTYTFRIRRKVEWCEIGTFHAENVRHAWAQAQRTYEWLVTVWRPGHQSSMVRCVSAKNVFYETHAQMTVAKQQQLAHVD